MRGQFGLICDLRPLDSKSHASAKFQRLYWSVLLWFVALVLFPVAAHSQEAPSQVTPQTLRPSPSAAPANLPSESAGLQAPVGADNLSVVIGHVVTEGAFPEFEEATHSLVEAIEGRSVTVAEIYAFANALEQIYARAGYVLVRVTVPPQELNDHGELRILVLDGFIEKVEADSIPDRARALVSAQTAFLVGRRHIKLEEIERRLLIVADVPGLRLRSTLARGATLGGALLVLEATHRPVSATASVDNRLPASLGTWSHGAGLEFNSLLGFGEQFYGSVESADDPRLIIDLDSPLMILGAGAVLPVGIDGWMVNPEYTFSRSDPEPESGGLDNIGRFERISLRSWYPVIRTRSKTLTLRGDLEHINQSVALPLFDTDLNRDRYTALRIGAALTTGLPWWDGGLQTSATFSQGLGGRDHDDANASGIPLSRQGAGPSFTKLNLDASLSVPLLGAFRLGVIGRAQISFGEPLLTPEHFFLDGRNAVSAYPSGALGVDEGGTLRGEFSRTVQLPGATFPLLLTPYGFGALGAGRLNDPTIDEIDEIHACAVGAGMHFDVNMPSGYQAAEFSLEVARQFSNVADQDDWRGSLSLNVRF